MEELITFDKVCLTYHTKESETPVLADMSFSVGRGELMGLVGPSGCGKTTVLSLISGIIRPTSGKVLTGGMAPEKCDISGYMLQKDELLPWRTNMANILLGAELKKRDKAAARQKALELLEKYDLKGVEKHYPDQLSGGMRQRVALIRTLVLAPQIILLDEPFSALDFQTRLQVVNDVYTMLKTEKMTAVFVTHNINEAISMCDRVAVLSSKPCHIKEIVDISVFKGIPPAERRISGEFVRLYDKILTSMQSRTEQTWNTQKNTPATSNGSAGKNLQ